MGRGRLRDDGECQPGIQEGERAECRGKTLAEKTEMKALEIECVFKKWRKGEKKKSESVSDNRYVNK